MMDKSCHSSGESAATNTNTISSSGNSSGSNKDHQVLKQLNKFSHKISKPAVRKPSFDHHLHHKPLVLEETQSQPSNLQQHQHQQPPVYNINKSDFRDVVQKLTGSPAHERFSGSAPPPIHQPKPQSSRLQRIRPPPLEHLSNRPPSLLNDAVIPQNPSNTISTSPAAVSGNFFSSQRQGQPFSPLPPFPAVHAAEESPISAYMRYLQGSSTTVDSDPKRFSGRLPLTPLDSQRWNSFAQSPRPLPPPPQQNETVRSPTSGFVPPLHFPTPSSPLPFGCLPSPRSPYPLLSPNLLFSQTNQFGFQQFPVSDTSSAKP